jgi:prolyl oligopeptidase
MNVRTRSILVAAALIAAFAVPNLHAATPAKAEKPATTAAQTPAGDDPYLWLEDVGGAKPLEWVGQRNAESAKAIAARPGFDELKARFLEILDSKAKIPTVTKIGDLYYNFWKDADHERGIWRRTTLAEYRKKDPTWETVLDLDALSKADNVLWVWHGAEALPPENTRCLVQLSRGGADAEVVREFDLSTRSFVSGGFELPEAKSETDWIDHDVIYVCTDFGPGSMTTSGYPRIVKEWKRGTPLTAATTVFEGKPEDVSAGVYRVDTPGFERDFVYRSMDFYSYKAFLRRDGKLIPIDKQDDADIGSFREWLLLRLRSDWTVGGKTWPKGALIAERLDDFLAGKRDFEMLFEPGPRTSIDSYVMLKDAILLNVLDNVRNRLYVVAFDHGAWTRRALPGMPDFGQIDVAALDARTSNQYWLTATDFLNPSRLHLGSVDMNGPPEKLKEQPTFFDASQLEVAQHEAISKDGTRIPYFQVSRKGMKNDGNNPTLLYGYGGFEISELPSYSATRGAGWMEKGGVFVMANIRGGGEFGPAWHWAGVKAERHHCYEDFIAVGEDLVKRKVTSPRHLACIGGSNGGLLVGNMLTMRPDLFGAVVCQVPLLDMRRYHTLLAGASWMGEYGNPDNPKEWAFIQEWSPYQHMKKDVHYPPTLFTTSTRDDRVHPGHARKMVAKMLDQGHDELYYENVEGGHGGASTNPQSAHMWALAYIFLWDHIGASAGTTAVEGQAKQP